MVQLDVHGCRCPRPCEGTLSPLAVCVSGSPLTVNMSILAVSQTPLSPHPWNVRGCLQQLPSPWKGEVGRDPREPLRRGSCVRGRKCGAGPCPACILAGGGAHAASPRQAAQGCPPCCPHQVMSWWLACCTTLPIGWSVAMALQVAGSSSSSPVSLGALWG